MTNGITVHEIYQMMVYTRDLRRARFQNARSVSRICDHMNRRGWSYYPKKIYRIEKQPCLRLSGDELLDLLTAYGSSPKPARPG